MGKVLFDYSGCLVSLAWQKALQYSHMVTQALDHSTPYFANDFCSNMLHICTETVIRFA